MESTLARNEDMRKASKTFGGLRESSEKPQELSMNVNKEQNKSQKSLKEKSEIMTNFFS